MSAYRIDDWGWRWAHGLELNEEERNRKVRAEKLARRNRWAFPGKVRVVHPKYGEVIVPGASKFAAILCAAEKWKCDWAEITDAEVWGIESDANDATSSVTADAAPPSPQGEGLIEKEQPARAGADCDGEKF